MRNEDMLYVRLDDDEDDDGAGRQELLKSLLI
jgi:hypothetical protein